MLSSNGLKPKGFVTGGKRETQNNLCVIPVTTRRDRKCRPGNEKEELLSNMEPSSVPEDLKRLSTYKGFTKKSQTWPISTISRCFNCIVSV